MTGDVVEYKIAFVNQSIWYCLLTVSYLHELSSCQQQCCGVCQVFPCNRDPSGHFVVHFGKSSSSTCGRVKSVPRPGFKDDQVWGEGGTRDKSSTSHKSNSQVVNDVAVQVWHHLQLPSQDRHIWAFTITSNCCGFETICMQVLSTIIVSKSMLG